MLRGRLVRKFRAWAISRAERRLQREWDEYQSPPEWRARWFQRDPDGLRNQNFRSLIQINFYRGPRS